MNIKKGSRFYSKEDGKIVTVSSLVKTKLGVDPILKAISENGITFYFSKSNFLEKYAQEDDYLKKLNDFKDLLMSEFDKVGNALDWVNARLSGIDKASSQYAQLIEYKEKAEIKLKQVNKDLEEVKKYIVDYTANTTELSLSNEIEMKKLDNMINFYKEKEVEEQEKEVDINKDDVIKEKEIKPEPEEKRMEEIGNE